MRHKWGLSLWFWLRHMAQRGKKEIFFALAAAFLLQLFFLKYSFCTILIRHNPVWEGVMCLTETNKKCYTWLIQTDIEFFYSQSSNLPYRKASQARKFSNIWMHFKVSIGATFLRKYAFLTGKCFLNCEFCSPD